MMAPLVPFAGFNLHLYFSNPLSLHFFQLSHMKFIYSTAFTINLGRRINWCPVQNPGCIHLSKSHAVPNVWQPHLPPLQYVLLGCSVPMLTLLICYSYVNTTAILTSVFVLLSSLINLLIQSCPACTAYIRQIMSLIITRTVNHKNQAQLCNLLKLF